MRHAVAIAVVLSMAACRDTGERPGQQQQGQGVRSSAAANQPQGESAQERAARVTTAPTRKGEAMPRPEVPLSAPVIVRDLQSVKWMPGPESLPKGVQVAVLEGAPPFPPNRTFTFLAKLPRNYTIPPHTHLATERVMVLSGVFSIGHGEKLERKAANRVMPGGVVLLPAGHPHFALSTDRETIIALTGVGPWEIIYVDPKDDPRPSPVRRPAQPIAHPWDASIQPMIVQAKDSTFEEPPPGRFAPGVKVASIEGSPDEAKTFIVRLQLPKNLEIESHSHPHTVRLFVISGSVELGLGGPEAKPQVLKAPAMAILPANTAHSLRARDGEAVIQLFGVGPFEMKPAQGGTQQGSPTP